MYTTIKSPSRPLMVSNCSISGSVNATTVDGVISKEVKGIFQRVSENIDED